MATSQVVVFKLGKQEYGLDIMKVIEIGDYKEATPVPEVPKYIEGIINIRGDIYPVYNLRTRFRMAEHAIDENTKIVQMNLNEFRVAFIVDNVCEILSIQDENIEETPKMIARYDSKYIKGITKKDDRIILLLDVDLLMSDADQQIIEGILA